MVTPQMMVMIIKKLWWFEGWAYLHLQRLARSRGLGYDKSIEDYDK